MRSDGYTIATSLTAAGQGSAGIVDVNVTSDCNGQKAHVTDPRLLALHIAFDLIKHARDCLFHAAYVTSDAELHGFAVRIGSPARSFQHELLHDIQAAIKQLQNECGK